MNRNTNLQPEIFYCSASVDMDSFDRLCKGNPSLVKIDTLSEQKHELNLVENPNLVSHEALHKPELPFIEKTEGVWAYFPWKNSAVRILEKEQYEKLRLSRNKNLITFEEQKILQEKTIGVVGLNVGNPGAVCLALEGIGNSMKLADFDPLSVSNLNRFRAGLPDIGINKAYISARQMYEVNPYLSIKVFDKGVTTENLDSFLDAPKIDLLIEEMDNLKFKIKIREKARKLGIPVIMVTGNSEDVIIDVERYDLDDKLDILSGYLKEEVIQRIFAVESGKGTFRERIDLLQDFMGSEYLDERLNESFTKVGDTLISVPQLAESSFLRGAVITHFAKKILLQEDIKSGRYEILLRGTPVARKHD